MQDPMKTIRRPVVGLACAGGVIEGALYEIGTLCALEDSIPGLDTSALDVYVGVSSGALITSLLANGLKPRTLSRAVVDRADPLLNVKPQMLFTPAVEEYGRRMARIPGSLFDAVKAHVTRPWDVSLLGALAGGMTSALPVGIFTNEPLQEHIASIFAQPGRTNDFRELPTVLRVVAMHLDSAQITTFGDPDTAHVPISKAVQASSALPGFYCPVEIDGTHYIDGVARRTVHASVALEAGAELLFCINPIVPVDLRDQIAAGVEESIVSRGLPAVLSQTFRALIYSRMQTGFRRYDYAYPEADTIRIEPRAEDPRLFFSNIFSFSNRYDVCEYAYRSTLTYLHENFASIDQKLRRHGLHLSRSVTDDTTRRLFETRSAAAAAGDPFEQAGDVLDRLERTLERIESRQTSGPSTAPPPARAA